MAKKTCGAEFVPADGNPTFACTRDDRHVVHKDDAGTRAVPVPGGAWIRKPKA